MLRRIIILFFFGLIYESCNNNSIFEEYTSVGNAWDIDRPVTYNFSIEDTITPYNLFIKLRTDNNYEFSNLFLDTSLICPSNKIFKDTLEYQMAMPDGSMLGSGYMSIKEHKLWFKGHNGVFKFPEKGHYKLVINQQMRVLGSNEGLKFLRGIMDVGFSIENSF